MGKLGTISIFIMLSHLYGLAWQKAPDVIEKRDGYTLWVSADALSHVNDQVLWKQDSSSIFGGILEDFEADIITSAVNKYKKFARKKNDGELVCSISMRMQHEGLPPINMRQVLEKAKGVLEVRIESFTPGFFSYTVGALVGVEIETVLQEPVYEHANPFYLHYGNARFKIGETPICVENEDYFFPVIPGLRLLIFALNPPSDKEGRVFYENPFYMIAETKDGGFLMADDLLGSPGLEGVSTFDELLVRTGELLSFANRESKGKGEVIK